MAHGGTPKYQVAECFLYKTNLKPFLWMILRRQFSRNFKPCRLIRGKRYFSIYYSLKSSRTCQYIGLQDAIFKQLLSQNNAIQNKKTGAVDRNTRKEQRKGKMSYMV